MFRPAKPGRLVRALDIHRGGKSRIVVMALKHDCQIRMVACSMAPVCALREGYETADQMNHCSIQF